MAGLRSAELTLSGVLLHMPNGPKSPEVIRHLEGAYLWSEFMKLENGTREILHPSELEGATLQDLSDRGALFFRCSWCQVRCMALGATLCEYRGVLLTEACWLAQGSRGSKGSFATENGCSLDKYSEYDFKAHVGTQTHCKAVRVRAEVALPPRY